MLDLQVLEDRVVPAVPDFGGVSHTVLVTPELDFVYLAGVGGGPRVVVHDYSGNEKASFYVYEPDFHGGVDAVYLSKRGELWFGANAPGGPVLAVYDLHGVELERRFVGDPGSRVGVRLADHLPASEPASVGFVVVNTNPFATVDYRQWNDVSGGWGDYSVAVRGTDFLPSEIVLAIWDAGGDGFDFRIAVGYGTPPANVDLVIDAMPSESALSLAQRIVDGYLKVS